MTMTTYDIANALCEDKFANWSRAGAFALAEYLEQLEADTGEEMDFDCVAIRCDYEEHESLAAWADSHFGTDRNGNGWKYHLNISEDMDEETIDDMIREEMNIRGVLIEFDGGVIVSSF